MNPTTKQHVATWKTNTEVNRLVDAWNITENQAKSLNLAFENETLDASEFFRIMNETERFEIFSVEDAEEIVKHYGSNNKLYLVGFEEYMNDCLSQESELERTYTEHPYLNHETNQIENPYYGDVCKSLLGNCEKNGDKANSKLAKETLDRIKVIGVEKGMEEMAVMCFKHPETGKQMSYSEMRSMYG